MSAGFGENERARLREIMDALPSAGARGRKRLEHLIASGAQSDDPPEFALDSVLLVDDVQDPRWQWLGRARLTTDERAYDEVLVPFLADLARSDASSPAGSSPGWSKKNRAVPLASAAGCSTGRDRRCPTMFASACPRSLPSRASAAIMRA
jgi:hypothetical protein